MITLKNKTELLGKVLVVRAGTELKELRRIRKRLYALGFALHSIRSPKEIDIYYLLTQNVAFLINRDMTRNKEFIFPEELKEYQAIYKSVKAKDSNKAWKLIQNGWCKGTLAKNNLNQVVPVRDSTACKFCTTGAITKVYKDDKRITEKINKLRKHLVMKTGLLTIVVWNDSFNTTKTEVVKTLKALDI